MIEIDGVEHALAHAWAHDDLARIGLQGHGGCQNRENGCGGGREAGNHHVVLPEGLAARGGRVHDDENHHWVDVPPGPDGDSFPESCGLDCDVHLGEWLELGRGVSLWVGRRAQAEILHAQARAVVRHLADLPLADDAQAGQGVLPGRSLVLHDLRAARLGLAVVSWIPLVWELAVALRRHARPEEAGFVGIPEPGANHKGQ